MTAPVVHALVIVGWLCLVGAVCCGLEVARGHLTRRRHERYLLERPTKEYVKDFVDGFERAILRDRDDDGHVLAGVAFGLAAEGLVALLLWAVLR